MKNSKVIHFIGIGGIGISALAFLALAENKKVTGSDQYDSDLINDLKSEGAHIYLGHQADHINEEVELVIYTSAIDPQNNPEYQRAKSLNIPVLSYFEALGQLSRTKKTIVVVGTHGKTTTTAMLGLALIRSGAEPTVIVGSKVKEFNGRNLYIGKGDLMIVEGCEYKRSFLNLQPFGIVFLNCEAEHLDYYHDEQDYKSAYADLIRHIPPDGFLIANQEDENVKELSQHCAGKVIEASIKKADELNLKLSVIGDFNQLNATHAYLAATALGAIDKTIRYGLEDFPGTWRRLENKGYFKDALVIDDYGHHPTELKATLKAIKEAYPHKEIICVFQPHQYSRTHLMATEFATAFNSADQVMITDIYEARDSAEDKSKINAEKLVETISKTHSKATWSKDLDHTYNLLKESVNKNQIIVTMGAGTIGKLAERLVDQK